MSFVHHTCLLRSRYVHYAQRPVISCYFHLRSLLRPVLLARLQPFPRFGRHGSRSTRLDVRIVFHVFRHVGLHLGFEPTCFCIAGLVVLSPHLLWCVAGLDLGIFEGNDFDVDVVKRLDGFQCHLVDTLCFGMDLWRLDGVGFAPKRLT